MTWRKIDVWDPVARDRTVLISPLAKNRFVDHTRYDTTSILKCIDTRWNLAPLGTRDEKANNLFTAFDLSTP